MNMKQVPVVLGFDYADPIGTLEVDMDRLSTHPDYLFALGFRALKVDASGHVTEYELVCVSPVEDMNYAAYLATLYGVA